ncbi:STM4014 family protein [Neomegalonema perideroedes]|uniref:STM4014 family protein n=1 Tax=Neomegalonema perideroedes TaxID=217219 RepID=UPI000366C048|nr:STM4014 family protein [Neomegalonema perideroedes]
MRLPLLALLAEPGPRLDSWRAACRRMGAPEPLLVSYAEALRHPELLTEAAARAEILRAESPGGGAEIQRLFAEAAGHDPGPLPEAGDYGRIAPPGPFLAGLRLAMARLAQAAAETGRPSLTDPEAVPLLFEKLESQSRFKAAGLPVPPLLGAIAGWEDLEAKMRAANLRRAFVKLRGGSAASGVAAVELQGPRLRLWTTATLEPSGALYNTRRPQRPLDDEARRWVDALGRLGAHAEAWIPKLKLDGLNADLRLVTLGGEPAHGLVRRAGVPQTNLHLGGERLPPEALWAQVGAETWTRILDLARRAAGLFPRHSALGLDLAVHEDGERVFLLEANAFGDHLKGALHEGLDPHEAQVKRMRAWLEAERGPKSGFRFSDKPRNP